MIDLIENFYWSKEEKTIVKETHKVDGLANFSYFNYTHSFKNFPWHKHSHIIEIHCMVNGERYAQIQEKGKINTYITSGNELIIIFPNEIHNNGDEKQAPCEFYAFQIDVSHPDNILGLSPEYSNTLCNYLLNLPYRKFRFGTSHLRWLRSAFNLFSNFDQKSIQVGVQFLTCFLFNLCYLTPVSNRSEHMIDPAIQKTVDYILEHLLCKMTLNELAEISGYSLSRFKIKFKENIGTAPAEFITVQKIEYAKKILIEKPISITDLAMTLDFTSSNYFSYVFHKYTGRTPTEYRKIYAK